MPPALKNPVFNENMKLNSSLHMKGALELQLKRCSELGANWESKKPPPIPILVGASKGKLLQAPQGRSLNRSP